jgi:hypothetical protein
MTRTTISLHESVLAKVRATAHESHSTMGETITELLNIGLRARSLQRQQRGREKFCLKSFSMGTPLVVIEDKEAVNAILDRTNL